MTARLHTALRENALSALASMWGQKLRSFLTLLGIVAGVATVILMVSLVAGFNNAVTSAFTQFGTQLVQFQKWEPRFGPEELTEEQRNRRDLTLDDADALKRLATFAGAVSPERYKFGGGPVVRSEKKEANSPMIFGCVPDYMEANTHFVEDGRFVSEADVRHASRVAVIGRDVAEALWPQRDPIGKQLTISGVAYSVIGTFEHKGGGLGGSMDNLIGIPISSFDDQFPEVKNGGGDNLHIATVPRRPEDYDALIEQETSILRVRRQLKPNQENDFAVRTSQGSLEAFQQVTNGIAAVMILIAGIALIVGGVGVMNIMLVNVTERTREIGVRKAIGATERDIAVQFLAEAVTLTGVGGGIGIAIGLGIGLLIRLAFDFPVATPLWSVVLGFGVSTVIGLIFGLWPALKAARLDPIEALRYE